MRPTLAQYITWKSAPDPKVPGKMTKHPADHRDGRAPVGAQQPAIWTTYEYALKRAAELGQEFGVGFVVTDADQYAFIDLDHCLTKDASGTPCWSAFARDSPAPTWKYPQAAKGCTYFSNIAASCRLTVRGRAWALSFTRQGASRR
jgi:primase-polymerase (primpol)-like protein